MQYAKGIEWEDLARGFIDLLSGSALLFCRKIFKSNLKWEEIKIAFLKRFEDPTFQMTEKSRLFNLCQKKDERAADYILEALAINSKLNLPLAEPELLSLVTKGLMPDYAQLKIGKNISNVSE